LSVCGLGRHERTAINPPDTYVPTMPRNNEEVETMAVGSPRHFRAVVERLDEVLVYFYTEGSEACQEIAPAIAALVDDAVVNVAEVNVEDNDRIASVYSVNSVPTVVLFRDGDPASRAVGAKTEEELREFVRQG